ncbi:nucleotide disphospho-sugar-binding domain-containing protein [Amycolatopsis aidingensis]|uniref:nucleotide disphospho-sugar-binding domain-containing protein n=1 Tax=Amycolatopsis aidingensis TaxID=2842453 RepID=UPI001C0B6E5B|nr:nucleotide disphospho-sugar-binding domain-containing protein [Amycolatopsis aidingensis]
MRVLFVVSSWPGHYFPMVPLGWALRAAGHEVHVLCAPSEVGGLTRAGLTPVPVLDTLDVTQYARVFNVGSFYLGSWPYPDPPPHPDTGEPLDKDTFDFQQWWDTTSARSRRRLHRSIDAARDYARCWRPHLVVHDLVGYEGPPAAEAAQVPNILHLWGPTGPDDGLDTVDGSNGNEQFTSATARHTLTELAGHDLAERIYGHTEYVLDPCPDPVAPKLRRGQRLPMRYVPYNGPGAVPLELPEPSGRPRVCMVWGRSGTRTFGAASNKLPQMIEAATSLDAEVLLLALREDVQGYDLPDTVHPMVEVPLHLVLPGCDAVVHYGSGGATMTSVAAGVPQLALPLAHNSALLTGRFTEVGCGLTVPNYEADVPSLRAALERLVGEASFAAAARDLAAMAAGMPTPAATVGTLEDIAGARTGPPASHALA